VIRSPNVKKIDPSAADMALAVWNILIKFNKFLVAPYTPALRLDLLKIH
jgi:hypothetical protein